MISGRRIQAAISLAGTFVVDLVAASLAVARIALAPSKQHSPSIVAVPVDARTEWGVALFAYLVSLTPRSTDHLRAFSRRARREGEGRRHEGTLRATHHRTRRWDEPLMTLPSMTSIATLLIAVLAVPLALAASRMIKGPGYADRIVALDMLTAVVVSLSALTAVATGRSAFLDIALGVALINFASTCAFATFLERKRGKK